MKISKRANKIKPSLTRRLFDKAKEYTDVIDFTLGDPDYQTPQSIKEAGCRAILDGRTRYSANAGLPQLREVIAAKIARESGVEYNPKTEILVSVGAMEALYLTLSCIIDEGDEVIIPAPYWINYEHMVELCGGVPVIVDTKEENDFIVEVEQIERAVTPKTVAIMLNSPNNPTGTIYDKETLQRIANLAKQKNILLIWDECYKNIVFDDASFTSILSFDGIKEHVVVINSCSKEYSMTGWRIGYAAAPRELVANMTKLQENIAACASLPSQYAAIEAWSKDLPEKAMMRKGFENRRNVLVEGINQIDKLSCKYPKGTFYAFVNISKTNMDSETFAFELLDKKQVAVVPGITYGQCCKNYIRIAYTLEEEKIKEGVKRIAEFIAEL